MSPITVLITVDDDAEATVARMVPSGLVQAAIVLVPAGAATGRSTVGGVPCTEIETSEPQSGAVASEVIEKVATPMLLRVSGAVDPHPTALRRMSAVVGEAGMGMVFGDYMDLHDDGSITGHPLSDHQTGSLQDTFPLGPLQLWSVAGLREAASHLRELPELRFTAWYALRLQVLANHRIERLPEPLCTLRPRDTRRSGEMVFDYLTASREAQIEAEQVCTRHLDRVGARLEGPFEAFVPSSEFPVEATVVIPVRDRERTILDAVKSALEQETDFEFNVIVVDNHSTDGTTAMLAARAAEDSRLVHVTPERRDLGIGGCWNVAVNHPQAGRYIVQLDSDDIYSGSDTLARMVGAMRDGQCGMAVGSYTLVNMALETLPPGLIDHKEWTPDNGPNNALRIGGLGAPRGFATDLVRQHPFPNASYGEDYAVVLRLSRTYRVGRVYDSLYLCRRWEDNSDADLPPDKKARFQTYKDRLRTLELAARIAQNKETSA